MLPNASASYILLLATCCSHALAASILSAPQLSRQSEETPRMALDLPLGFRPQSPPMQPLLYPFVSAAPSGSSDWKPIVGRTGDDTFTTPAATTQHNALLQERVSMPMEEGPILESIVYGAWKPQPPVQPIQTQATTPSTTARPNAATYEQLGQQHPIAAVLRTPTFVPKNSRQRVDATLDKSTETAYEVPTLNVSDPKLLALAKQINDSAESVPTPPQRSTNKPFKSTWPPASDSTEADKDASKVWPTDFTASNEAFGASSAQRVNFSYLGDSSDPPLALNGLNIPNALLAQTTFNITKVGVPYERHNSVEEPSICVPLTVREKLNTAEVIDVERVYCFPLPQTEVQTMKRKANDTATSAKIQNVTEYEAPNSAARNLTEITFQIMFISLTMWLLRFNGVFSVL